MICEVYSLFYFYNFKNSEIFKRNFKIQAIQIKTSFNSIDLMKNLCTPFLELHAAISKRETNKVVSQLQVLTLKSERRYWLRRSRTWSFQIKIWASVVFVLQSHWYSHFLNKGLKSARKRLVQNTRTEGQSRWLCLCCGEATEEFRNG